MGEVDGEPAIIGDVNEAVDVRLGAMRWFGLPIALCGLGLPEPAPISIATVATMRCVREFGLFETAYLVGVIGLGCLGDSSI